MALLWVFVAFILLSNMWSVTTVKTDEFFYSIVGMNDQNTIVDECTFLCYESNCSVAAIQALNCPNVSWIEFDPSDTPCELFDKWGFSTINYTVFAIDDEQNIMADSIEFIPNFFTAAVNYGCALLTLWPDAVWFGMSFVPNVEFIHKPMASCFAECAHGYCSIDCPVGHAAYCFCNGGINPSCSCR
jgi:hypothetical protein